jgi:hypothetical protein
MASDPRPQTALVDPIDIAMEGAVNLAFIAALLGTATPVYSIEIGAKRRAENEVVGWLQTFSGHAGQATGTVFEPILGGLVRRARDLGIPWQRIADALGVAAPSIYKKAGSRGWVNERSPELDTDDEAPAEA